VALVVVAGAAAVCGAAWLLVPAAPPPDSARPETLGVLGQVAVQLTGALHSGNAVISALRHEVRCPVTLADPVEGPVDVAIELASADAPAWISADAQLRDRELVFTDIFAESLHHGSVKVPGYVRTALDWDPVPGGGFDCPGVALRQAAVVVGRVAPPAANASVRGCGGAAEVAPDGSFYLEGTDEPCELIAERADGAYTVTSPPVAVQPRLGEEVEVALRLPDQPQAGFGMTIEPDVDGMRILALSAGAAAAQAGLQVGDLVVSIDGVPAGDDPEAFRDRAIGDVGSSAEIEVISSAGRETLQVVRVFVPLDGSG
jgi:hypothetical protein